jgi:hypothetical protein
MSVESIGHAGPLQIIGSAIGLAVPKRPARHQSLPSQRLQVLKHQKVIGLSASQSRDRMGFALPWEANLRIATE